MSELYNKDILRLAAIIPHHERLEGAAVSVTRTSRVCGSKITVDVCFDGDSISDFGQAVHACALGQAAASLMARRVIGLDRAGLITGTRAFQALVKHGTVIDDENWQDFNLLRDVHDHPGRHMSVMLPFDALTEAFDKAGL